MIYFTLNLNSIFIIRIVNTFENVNISIFFYKIRGAFNLKTGTTFTMFVEKLLFL